MAAVTICSDLGYTPTHTRKRLWLSSITQEKVKVAHLWPPWTIAHQSPLSMAFPQARILEWVAFPFSRGIFPTQGSKQVSCTAGGFFTSWATREGPLTQEPRPQFVCVRVEHFPFFLHLPTKLLPHLPLSGPSSLFPPSLPTSEGSKTFRCYLLYFLSYNHFIILSPHVISYSLSCQQFTSSSPPAFFSQSHHMHTFLPTWDKAVLLSSSNYAVIAFLKACNSAARGFERRRKKETQSVQQTTGISQGELLNISLLLLLFIHKRTVHLSTSHHVSSIISQTT